MNTQTTGSHDLFRLVCIGLTALATLAWPQGGLAGQAEASAPGVEEPQAPKLLSAIRVESGSLSLDGRLDEEAWSLAEPRSDFMQKGRYRTFDPGVRTFVRFLYDDAALYVGARMEVACTETWCTAPPREIVGQRDDAGNSERILVSLDTYRSRESSYTFGVTVGGVRVDYLQGRDLEGWADYSYNPDWTAEVSYDADGWTAEMRIPFSQLRFSADEVQAWGLNVRRWNPETFLNVYWVAVPEIEPGWTSRFGQLEGMGGIEGGAALSVTPYAMGRSILPDRSLGYSAERDVRFGGEAKLGLGPNLTLDATINPDFGQVEADPARVNLTAFETFFPENRPFFIEGADLFRTPGAIYFYSRRVGSAPGTILGGGVFEEVENTTVLGGVKLTGRPAGLFSVSVLSALTDREVVTNSVAEAIEVAPRSLFVASRLQRDAGEGSNFGFTGTAVERFMDEDGSLVDFIPDRALAGGGDWSLRFGGGQFRTTGHLGGSLVFGSDEAIARVQQSSAHWFQRPDATHVNLRPSLTLLRGWTAGLALEKDGGESWLWDLGVSAASPGFEIRDAGSQTRADRIDSRAGLRYVRREADGPLPHWSLGGGLANSWNFGGVRTQSSLSTFFAGTWANLWNTYLEVGASAAALSDDLTRGGPLAASPQSGYANFEVTGPTSNNGSWHLGMEGYDDTFGSWNASWNVGFTWLPSSRIEVGAFGGSSRGSDGRVFAGTHEGGPVETFGTRYVFSSMQRRELFTQIRAKVAFATDAVLTVYAEPFSSSGRVTRLGELRAARSDEIREYGTDGTQLVRLDDGGWQVSDGEDTFTVGNYDFLVRSFRATGVFRWEWRRGSTLFLIWQRGLWSFSDRDRAVILRDLAYAIKDPGQDIFAVKMTVLIGG